MYHFFNKLKFLGLAMLLFAGLACEAQWMTGFRYRKAITINKDKVEPLTGAQPATYLDNFFVLIRLEDPDFKYHVDAFENKISNPQGLDISFATFESAGTALKFQLDSYDPERGKLSCWVMVPRLNTRAAASGSIIYFYYGSASYHQPDIPATEQIWNDGYHHVQHFKNGVEGKIGTGRSFKALSDVKYLKAHPNTEYVLSAWIKFNATGADQMIMSNDSAGVGYQLKITADQKIAFSIPRASWSYTSSNVLQANEWHYFAISFRNAQLLFVLNGVLLGTPSSPSVNAALAGQVVIGGSKQGSQFFDGVIDEVRIGRTIKPRQWMITEYTNQSDPAAFIMVGPEAVRPGIGSYAHTFLGNLNKDYNHATNWDIVPFPTDLKNIIIKAGTTAAISTDVTVNRLKLAAGAKIELRGNLKVSGSLTLEPGASIVSNTNSQLQVEGGLTNHGEINLSGAETNLLFSGGAEMQSYSGAGIAVISRLKVNRPAPQSMLTLAAPLQVTKTLELVNGELNANGNLVLLNTNRTTAALLKVPASASISGNVHVQIFVDGTFPLPASGRGWRLLSSPVMHTTTAEGGQYHLQHLQNKVFITGKGGTANGFDASPNNGATIYTHNQSLQGTLAQKYVPIARMDEQIPIGKGFFIYSRGDRTVPNAYQQQVQSPPFSNAAPYILTYTGRLFTGNLMVEVFNNDKGGEGDGFNLVGNPYAAPIKWGDLVKTNIGEFFWLFDPLNNTYRTSSSAEEIIPPGAGFFIKVKQGSASGTIVFSENSKSIL